VGRRGALRSFDTDGLLGRSEVVDEGGGHGESPEMLSAVLTLTLVALASETPPEKATLLVTDLAHSESVAPDVARTLTDLVTAECARDEVFRVMSGNDIRNMIALEGEKQALGCDGEQTCLADLAGALGARFVIFGRVSTLDRLFVLQLELMDATTGAVIGRIVEQGGSVSQFTGKLRQVTTNLLAKAHETLKSEGHTYTAAAEPAGPTEPSWLPVGLQLGGAGAIVLGALSAALAIAFIGVQLPQVVDTSTDVSARRGAQTLLQVGVGLGVLGAVITTGGLGVAGVGIFLE
jgi:hypothetical protein